MSNSLSANIKKVMDKSFGPTQPKDLDHLLLVTATILEDPIVQPMSPLALAIFNLGQPNLPDAVADHFRQQLCKLLSLVPGAHFSRIDRPTLHITYGAFTASIQDEASGIHIQIWSNQSQPAQPAEMIDESLQHTVKNKLTEIGVISRVCLVPADLLEALAIVPPAPGQPATDRSDAAAINQWWDDLTRQPDASDLINRIKELKKDLPSSKDPEGITREINACQSALRRMVESSSCKVNGMVKIAWVSGALAVVCGGITLYLGLGCFGIAVTLTLAGYAAKQFFYNIPCAKKTLEELRAMWGSFQQE